jgi:hypothetical protein
MRNAGQVHLDRPSSAARRGMLTSPERDLVLTPEQIRDLSLTLYTFIFESGDKAPPKAMSDRCIRTCQKRGLDLAVAAMISEVLTGYIYGGSSQGSLLVTCVPKAQVVLHLAMGGHKGVVMDTRPAGARLAPYAIAEMIAWVLTVGVDKRL